MSPPSPLLVADVSHQFVTRELKFTSEPLLQSPVLTPVISSLTLWPNADTIYKRFDARQNISENARYVRWQEQ
jgi:hypothetical protein